MNDGVIGIVFSLVYVSLKEPGVVGSDTYTWGIKDFHKCWSGSLAKRRLCLGPTSIINCIPLSALSFWVFVSWNEHGYNNIRQFFWLCLPSGQLSGFFFHTCPALELSLRVHMHPKAKMDLEVKASGRNKTHYGLALCLGFWLQGAFLCMYTVSLTFYSEESVPLFVLAMIIPLRCKQETKTSYLPCSALLTMPKPLTVWITIKCGNSERDGNTRPPDLPLEKPICRSGSNS